MTALRVTLWFRHAILTLQLLKPGRNPMAKPEAPTHQVRERKRAKERTKMAVRDLFRHIGLEVGCRCGLRPVRSWAVMTLVRPVLIMGPKVLPRAFVRMRALACARLSAIFL